MIGKAKSCIGGYSLFHYVMQDEKGFELVRNNLCGASPLEVMQEMKILQNLNQRATNKLISIVLSPDVKDGENLNKSQLKKITIDFLKDMNINTDIQQYLAFVHTEKRHKHIHILVNRVDEKGQLNPDHFIGKKAQWSAHRTAEKWKLISAKQQRIDKINNQKEEKLSANIQKHRIKEAHFQIMRTNPLSLENYILKMREQDIKFIPSINKQGNLQGFKIKDLRNQKEYKASDIHKSLGLKSLLESGLPILNANILLHSKLLDAQEIAKKKAKEIEYEINKNQQISIIESKETEQKRSYFKR